MKVWATVGEMKRGLALKAIFLGLLLIPIGVFLLVMYLISANQDTMNIIASIIFITLGIIIIPWGIYQYNVNKPAKSE